MSLDLAKAQPAASRLSKLLESVPAGVRGALLISIASFRPNATLKCGFAVGDFRAAFADCWETRFNSPVPIAELRSVLEPPIPIRTAIEFSKFAIAREAVILSRTYPLFSTTSPASSKLPIAAFNVHFYFDAIA